MFAVVLACVAQRPFDGARAAENASTDALRYVLSPPTDRATARRLARVMLIGNACETATPTARRAACRTISRGIYAAGQTAVEARVLAVAAAVCDCARLSASGQGGYLTYLRILNLLRSTSPEPPEAPSPSPEADSVLTWWDAESVDGPLETWVSWTLETGETSAPSPEADSVLALSHTEPGSAAADARVHRPFKICHRVVVYGLANILALVLIGCALCAARPRRRYQVEDVACDVKIVSV